MRCVCCNRGLNDYESTLRSAETEEFLDTCNRCIKGLGIKTLARTDLKPDEDAPTDWDEGGGIPLLFDNDESNNWSGDD